MFDYLVAHGRMKEKEARSKFRQVKINKKLFELMNLILDCICCSISSPKAYCSS